MFYEHLSDLEKMIFRRRSFLLLTLACVFLAVLILSYGVSAWKEAKEVLNLEPRLMVNVSGEGKVSARPDIARTTAAVLTENATLKEAEAENSKKSNALVEYLVKNGVEKKDIKTIGYNIFPRYNYPSPCYPGAVCPAETFTPKIVGYQIRNTYEVTIRDLAKASDIVSGMVGAGANEVSGIVFTIDQPDTARAQAREKAIDDARAKAKKLAKDLGKRVGKIVNFSEGGYPGPIYAREVAYGKGGGGVDAAPAPTPSLEPGQNEIIVNVSITYEFK